MSNIYAFDSKFAENKIRHTRLIQGRFDANLAIFGNRSLSQSFGLLLSSSSSKIPNLALEFRGYLSEFQRCYYFRFCGPYRYFRLLVVVVVTC